QPGRAPGRPRARQRQRRNHAAARLGAVDQAGRRHGADVPLDLRSHGGSRGSSRRLRIRRDMTRRFSVIGLGRLGAGMAAAVTGVDVNRAAVDALNAGRARAKETALQDLIAPHRARLRATMSCDEAIRESELTFVVVPTPGHERGALSLRHVAAAFRDIGAALIAKNGWHTVVLTSNVLPGATRHALVPVLERHSRRTAGADVGVCYSPVFVALGSVIRDFLNPDFLLVGELGRRSGDHLAACYGDIIGRSTPQVTMKRMTLENAELAKMSV